MSTRAGGDRESDRDADRDDFKNPEDAAASLFDLRYLIGGLFTFYGILLTVASFFIPHVKSGDININLWLGLAMLALGVLFLLWARARPLRLEGPSALARAEDAGPRH